MKSFTTAIVLLVSCMSSSFLSAQQQGQPLDSGKADTAAKAHEKGTITIVVPLIGPDAVHPTVHGLIRCGVLDTLDLQYGSDGYRILCVPDQGRPPESAQRAKAIEDEFFATPLAQMAPRGTRGVEEFAEAFRRLEDLVQQYLASIGLQP